MSTKSREVIWGGRIMGAEIRAQGAREAARKAAHDRADAEAWSIRMEGYGEPRAGVSYNRPSLMVVSVGSKWSAIAVSLGRACRSMPSAGRATHLEVVRRAPAAPFAGRSL
jgi:hypothetical protein